MSELEKAEVWLKERKRSWDDKYVYWLNLLANGVDGSDTQKVYDLFGLSDVFGE